MKRHGILLVLLLAALNGACSAPARSPDAETPLAADVEWARRTIEYTTRYRAGEYAPATAAARQALAAAETAFGAADLRTAQVRNDLARLLTAQGDPAAALTLDQAALEARAQAAPPQPAAVVQSLLNVASDLEALQRLPEADPLLERAISLLEAEQLAAAPPQLLDAVARLALLRMERQDAAAALPLFQRLDGQREALGGLNPERVIAVWEQYAACLRQLGREAEAPAMEQRAAARRAAQQASPDNP